MRDGMLIAVVVFGLAGSMAAAAVDRSQAPRREQVTFARGASSATITGRLTGDQMVDYVVRASAGQTLAVTLDKSNLSNSFNVLPPGSQNEAMFVGQTGESFSGLLPATGDYVVRVYLVRSAARRGESSDYTLTISATGEPLVPIPESQDAMIPGTSFHASTRVTCVAFPYRDEGPQQCEAFVTRWKFDGTATVEVVREGSANRRILFLEGKPAASDAPGAMSATREDDLTTITFDSGERYVIVDALIFGG